MPTVSISAPAVVFDVRNESGQEDSIEVEDQEILQSLDGIQSDEVFSDYICDSDYSALVAVGIQGGILRFQYDGKSKRLYGVTQYLAARELTKSELTSLRDYTIGQWSDGIGENFFQERMEFGFAPQLWFGDDNEVVVEQKI